ncbi:MAG: hypothetical protein NT149_01275 [Candidatus Gottesmanbacteria bacterium]|nr:hypothetical protein [Candidatus Gottesmanbacteria bacterium]
MDTKSRWKYVLVAVYAFLVVVVGVYLVVSKYYHVPLASLLPSNPSTKSMPVVSPSPRVIPTSVQRLTSTNGVVSYNVNGKFVTNPTYTAQNLLQSDFVIDEDPSAHRIPVVMTSKTGEINVGRAKGSLMGRIDWKLEDAESLRQSINVDAPAQIRLQPLSSTLTAYIPDDLVLHPPVVVVVE